MTYIQTMKDLAQNKIFPVYLLYGNETYLLQNVQQKIIAAVLDNPEQNMNYSVLDMEEVPVQDAIHDAETFPFFDEKKVIMLKNSTFFKPVPDKGSVEHDLKVLAAYLENPVDYTVLVFICPYEKVDERKKVLKLIKENGQVVPCQEPKENELYQWIKLMAEDLNIKMDQDVIPLLIEEIGTDLMALSKELEKLSLYAEDGKSISRETAEALISRHVQSSGFKMIDAVMNNQLSKAISMYKGLLKQSEEPIALLALLASQIRLILQSKILKNKGYTGNQIAKQLKVHPFRVKMALEREKYFAMDKLQHMIDLLTRTDDQIKRGEMDKELAIELLLYELIQSNKKSS
ncbi:MAG: DNA polymerase III subunit delta [Bacillaceae bacterium]|nr:DNA polymerase III subunit delta [Bacillaceae bacterium]